MCSSSYLRIYLCIYLVTIYLFYLFIYLFRYLWVETIPVIPPHVRGWHKKQSGAYHFKQHLSHKYLLNYHILTFGEIWIPYPSAGNVGLFIYIYIH